MCERTLAGCLVMLGEKKMKHLHLRRHWLFVYSQKEGRNAGVSDEQANERSNERTDNVLVLVLVFFFF